MAQTSEGFDVNMYNTTTMSSLVFSSETVKTIDSEKPVFIGYILAVSASVCSVSQTIVQIRKLLHISILIFVFWLATAGIPVAFIASLIFEDLALPADFVSWLLVLGCVAGAVFYSFVATLGQVYASPVIIQLAYSTQLFLSFLGQYFLLQHIFPSDGSWIEIMGAVFSSVAVTLVPSTQLLMVKCNK